MKYWVLRHQETIVWVSRCLMIMIAFTLFDTLWQYATGFSIFGHPYNTELKRLTGPIDNVKVGIFLAKMMIPVCGVLFFSALHKKNRLGVCLHSAIFLIAVIVIMATGERTAFSSLIIAFLCISTLLVFTDIKLGKYALATLCLIVFSANFMLATQEWVQKRAIDFKMSVGNYEATEYMQLAKSQTN
jgi:hypothetical protein